jgi:hypothetical protein
MQQDIANAFGSGSGRPWTSFQIRIQKITAPSQKIYIDTVPVDGMQQDIDNADPKTCFGSGSDKFGIRSIQKAPPSPHLSAFSLAAFWKAANVSEAAALDLPPRARAPGVTGVPTRLDHPFSTPLFFSPYRGNDLKVLTTEEKRWVESGSIR